MENGNNLPTGGTADAQAEPNPALTEDEIGDEIGALVEDSLDSEKPEDKSAKPAKDETPESNEEAEPEEETEPEAEEKPEEEKPEQKANTVKLKDGTEVPLDDLVNGYLRQSDYTRKTQAVSEKEKQLESAAQKLLQQHQERQAYGDLALKVLERYAPKEPDPALINTDPVGYMQQERAYRNAREDFEKLARANQGTQQQTLEQQKREHEAALAREQEVLFQKLPELRKAETAKAFWDEAIVYGDKAYGLSAQDIAAITDHRAMLVLKDAVAYRKLQANKMEAVRKAKEAPPIRSAARPGGDIAKARAQKDALARLREEGTVEAAVATLPDELFN